MVEAILGCFRMDIHELSLKLIKKERLCMYTQNELFSQDKISNLNLKEMGACGCFGGPKQTGGQANQFTFANCEPQTSRNSQRCLVYGCEKDHAAHYCKVCQDKNSSHFARNCRPKQKCLAVGCKQAHSSHYCKVCQDANSNHRARDCKAKVPQAVEQPQALPAPAAVAVKKCLAVGCKQEHSSHYCKICQNTNSNHRARDCKAQVPQIPKPPQIQKIVPVPGKPVGVAKKCLVADCTQEHASHYCRVCLNEDSDHFSKNCTNQAMTAYHGTSLDCYQNIKTEGLKPSTHGNLGPGVYMTNDRDVAMQIAQDRAGKRQSKPVVLECRIPKDQKTTQEGFHGKWKNVTDNGFTEYVVKDHTRIRIVKAHQDGY